METGKMKLALSAGAVALSMALAGCGGGSSSSPVGPGDESGDNDNGTPATITCGPGTNLVGRVCVIPERDRANQDKAEALKEAINATGAVRWSASTGGAITNNTTIPKFIGPDGARIELAKDDKPVAALGSWKGSDQSGKHSSGTSAMLRAYSSQGAPTTPEFSAVELEEVIFGAGPQPVNGVYSLVSTPPASKDIAGEFPAVGAGVETYVTENERKIRGTYKGAPGEYTCSGAAANACSATSSASGGVDLSDGGTWKFKPDADAKFEIKDGEYLQFGWWVHKDASGAATHANVFYAPSTGLVAESSLGVAALDGKTATYTGSAAGKFAVYHLTEDINESGHFTADAMLKGVQVWHGADMALVSG